MKQTVGVDIFYLFMMQATRAAFTLNGVFKETAKSLNEEDLILGFHRAFIISRHSINQVMVIDKIVTDHR